MTSAEHPFDRIVRVAPGLVSWWLRERAEGTALDDLWKYLALEILDRRLGDRLPDLLPIAGLLDEFLERFDDRGQISLGFIHTIALARERYRLDDDAIRSAFGPGARRQWDALVRP